LLGDQSAFEKLQVCIFSSSLCFFSHLLIFSFSPSSCSHLSFQLAFLHFLFW